ncbi:putative alcohol dehydrogenase [Aspergillus steynii IBT 23096]|uniref:Putative alcohol dehydrogenase n=1 Tax=Aspergillus steynii IBT 23096 TaxID=1392250 RepID=A0A2I2GSB6_9EURO|nr:putative alcohol dehydrogenase [Aspergillus steynii IBT 23096]PLB55768.1 putative alcohol dehydrogenase [Aspergillus steynii IBT 23096]
MEYISASSAIDNGPTHPRMLSISPEDLLTFNQTPLFTTHFLQSPTQSNSSIQSNPTIEPATTMSKALYLTQVDGKPGQVYYPLNTQTKPAPTPQGRELLIRMTAAALNHRDVFLRQHLYPGITFDVPLGSDGVGVVVGAGPDVSSPERWHGKRVILNPGLGWKDSPDGPEDPNGYRIMGGTRHYRTGTLQEFLVVDEGEAEEAPEHLSDAEAAAMPLTGLTGWRALVVKGGERNSGKGAAVLLTGIGGGVALMALRFAIARGADVFVTSSSEEKIRRAVELGARGGVSYKEEGWEKKLLAMLPEGKKFDAIIDGAGGDAIEKGVRLLKLGGILSVYGMTVAPKMPFLMQAVMRNIEVRGSTMGSRQEFKEMVEFVRANKIRPVVSRVLQTDLDDIAGLDALFQDMKEGKQFGKLVVEFGKSSESKL